LDYLKRWGGRNLSGKLIHNEGKDIRENRYIEQCCYEGFCTVQGTRKLRLATEIDSAGTVFRLPIAIEVK
jgi:hypothetical protein